MPTILHTSNSLFPQAVNEQLTANILKGFANIPDQEQVETLSENEFFDKFSKGYIVLDEVGLKNYITDIIVAAKQLPIEQQDEFIKSHKDITKLVRKQVTDRHGKQRTVYVSPEQPDDSKKK